VDSSDPTLIARLRRALLEHGERPLLVTPGRAREVADHVVRGSELLDLAARVADGLRSLGLESGEPVLLWSENRDRWLAVDLALLALGAPDVPRGVDAPADEVQFVAEKVRARFAFVERPELLRRLAGRALPFTTVVLLTGEPATARADAGRAEVLTFELLLARADGAAARDRFDAAVAARRPDEVATIVFTSGTTGRPKGVVLTQHNLASNLAQVLEVIGFVAPGGVFLSILPPWHMFERMVEYALLSLGVTTLYTDRRHFAHDLKERRPSALAAVPRLWLLLMEGVLAQLAKLPARKRRLVEKALELASQRERGRRRFGGARRSLHSALHSALRSALLAPVDAVLRRLALRPIARALGVEQLRRVHGGLAISGGGSLPDHVDVFFSCLGVELLNGWGLTETSPVLTIRLPSRNRGGTVGPPLAQTMVEAREPESGRVCAPAERGVLHARGPQVMRGYFDDEEATRRVLTADGWFDTGDLGHVTSEGDVAITGRAKDTIVLLSGENVEPEPLENALVASPSIEQAVVVGQDRKFLAALVLPRRRDGEPEPARGDLLAKLRREIDECVSVRRGFRAHERIVRFALLERPLTVEEGLLSQTLKVKRAVVQERFARVVDALYDDEETGFI
jgi:long-chain acyl-CoA synthetase